jgi:TRAP-type transport system small permease protein
VKDWLSRIGRLLAWCDRGLMLLASVAIVLTTLALVALVLFLVLDRTTIGTSFMGTHELALLAAMWLYMVGAVVAMRNREHITVNYLSSRLTNARVEALRGLLVALVVLGCAVFFVRLAQDMLAWSQRRPQRTPSLGLPLIYAQASLIAAAGFCLLYALRDLALALVQLARSWRSRPDATPPGPGAGS